MKRQEIHYTDLINRPSRMEYHPEWDEHLLTTPVSRMEMVSLGARLSVIDPENLVGTVHNIPSFGGFNIKSDTGVVKYRVGYRVFVMTTEHKNSVAKSPFWILFLAIGLIIMIFTGIGLILTSLF